MHKLERFQAVTREMGDLYSRKNSDYGDSFSKARKEIPCYALGKIFDKFNRYMTLEKVTQGGGAYTPKVKTESKRDTLIDLACYAIMEIMELDAEGATK